MGKRSTRKGKFKNSQKKAEIRRTNPRKGNPMNSIEKQKRRSELKRESELQLKNRKEQERVKNIEEVIKAEEEERKKSIIQKNKMRRQGLENIFSIASDAPDLPDLEWLESLEQKIDGENYVLNKKFASGEVELEIKKEDGEISLFLTEDGKNFRIYERGTDDAPYELIETNKTRPLRRTRARAENVEFLLKHSERYKEQEVKYVGSDGVPIDPTSDIHKKCETVFEKVKIGKEILPAKPSKNGKRKNKLYHERVPRKKLEPILRTYGQEYLNELSDEDPIQGKLLGSGDMALAFCFGEIYIIESTDLNKATYIVTKDSFETIRPMSRKEAMRLSEEQGLIDRIFHRDADIETWKERITLHLNGDLEHSLTSEAENDRYEG
jgi:hypothetical protein